jgi:hypothetical protein
LKLKPIRRRIASISKIDVANILILCYIVFNMSIPSDAIQQSHGLLHEGRLAPDGSWPTLNEWARNPASPADAIFDSEEAALSYFATEIEAINDLLSKGEAVPNARVIENLMTIVGTRPDLAQSVNFEYLKPLPGAETQFRAVAVFSHPNPDSKVSALNLRINDRVKDEDPSLPDSKGVGVAFVSAHEPHFYGVGKVSGGFANSDAPNGTRFEIGGLSRICDLEAAKNLVALLQMTVAEIYRSGE